MTEHMTYFVNCDKDQYLTHEDVLIKLSNKIDMNNVDEIQCMSINNIGQLCLNGIDKIGLSSEVTINNNKCSICLEQLKIKETQYSFNHCGHIYHKKCIIVHFNACKLNVCTLCNINDCMIKIGVLCEDN